MKIHEMSPDERIALGSLVRVIVRLDGELTPEESAELDRVAAKLGKDDFWKAVEEAASHDLAEQTVMERARAVERPGARETIYATLVEIAEAGTIMGAELSMLEWLGKEWGLGPGRQDD